MRGGRIGQFARSRIRSLERKWRCPMGFTRENLNRPWGIDELAENASEEEYGEVRARGEGEEEMMTRRKKPPRRS